MELVWNVFVEDINARKIEVHNIFDHHRFMEDLVDIKKEVMNDRNAFADKVRTSLMYFYWSKCEWEVVVTSWPPYVNGSEIGKLEFERNNAIENYGGFIRASVNLETDKKIDVYDQVMMNWDVFIEYLWNNRYLIKKPK